MEEEQVAEDEYIDQEEPEVMEMENKEAKQNMEPEVKGIVKSVTQEPTSIAEPMEEEVLQQERTDIEEIVNITAKDARQEPASIMEPMEEDGPRQERLEVEEIMGLTKGESMDIMDGVETLIQESTFINVMLQGIVRTPSTQEMLDMGSGVTQEPPPTPPA